MELDSRKKRRQDRMMHSKSFETQEMREIGRKKARESRGIPILWMGITEDVFMNLASGWLAYYNLCWSGFRHIAFQIRSRLLKPGLRARSIFV